MNEITVPPIVELRRRVLKPEAQSGKVPWISRKVIHPHISIYLTSFLLRLGVNGNQATGLMLICALLGAGFFFLGGLRGYLGGAGLMLLSWILDHCDGEVLRFRGESSSLGIYMDRFTHRVSYPLVHLGIGTSLYRQTGQAWLLLFAGVVAYFFQVGVANSLDRKLIAQDHGDVELYPLRALRLKLTAIFPGLGWPLKLAIGAYAELFENNTLMVLIAAAAIFGVVHPFYLVYGTLLIFNWLLTALLDFSMGLGGYKEKVHPNAR
jgi:phosphatidylglycerophosphate synthase